MILDVHVLNHSSDFYISALRGHVSSGCNDIYVCFSLSDIFSCVYLVLIKRRLTVFCFFQCILYIQLRILAWSIFLPFQRRSWAATWQNQQCCCAPSEDSDQPGHPPILIRVFAVCSVCSSGPKLFSCGQRRLWPDWAESSLGAHSLCWVCHVAAHLL